MPYVVMQAINIAVVLCGVMPLGALGALVTWLRGGPVEGGFWGGVTVGFIAFTLAVAYLCWGGLLEWLSMRRRG